MVLMVNKRDPLYCRGMFHITSRHTGIDGHFDGCQYIFPINSSTVLKCLEQKVISEF